MLTGCEGNAGGFCDDFRNIRIFNDSIEGFTAWTRGENGNHIGCVPSCGTGRPYASISYTRLMVPGDGASDFPIDLMLWIDKRSIISYVIDELVDFLIRKGYMCILLECGNDTFWIDFIVFIECKLFGHIFR